MERHELAALAKSMGRMVREFVEPLYANLKSEIAELRVGLKEIPVGPVGPQGVPGEKGDTGPTGPQGERGTDGDGGARGEPGIQGEPGQPGERGLAGLNGERGEKGLDGKDGRDGRDGIAGKDGRDGDPGRDALQIEILPMIDPAKSYPRGTYARHWGGILRAIENTQPATDGIIKGWETVVDGIADIQVTQGADLRTFTLKIYLTSSGHTPRLMQFSMPVVIQRGIFKDGTEYSQGDQVVSDNSTWTCMVEATKARPGMSKDWLLSARKGDKGKDGQSITGPQGPPGRDGKDLTHMDFNGRKY